MAGEPFLIAYAIDTQVDTGFNARSGRCLLLDGLWDRDQDDTALHEARQEPWWTNQGTVDLEDLVRWIASRK